MYKEKKAMLARVANDTSVSNFMDLVYYINKGECFFYSCKIA